MRALLQRFARDRGGAATVELALVAPAILVLALVTLSLWLQGAGQREVDSALNAGVDYYIGGGMDDAEAQLMIADAWSSKPEDGAIGVVRECRCGVTVQACTSSCSAQGAPANYVKLSASGTLPGLYASTSYTAQRSLRVQ